MPRVLRPGTLIGNVWDRIEHNDYADATEAGPARFCPDDPPRFLSRAPYGYTPTASRSPRTLPLAGSRRRPLDTKIQAIVVTVER